MPGRSARTSSRRARGPPAGTSRSASPRAPASCSTRSHRKGSCTGSRGREERRPRDARASVHLDGRRSGTPRRANGRRGTVRRVSDRVGMVLAPEARIYDHGPEHPLRPDRVLLTWGLIHAYELDRRPNVETSGVEPADDPTLELVHTPAFIVATKRAGPGGAR